MVFSLGSGSGSSALQRRFASEFQQDIQTRAPGHVVQQLEDTIVGMNLRAWINTAFWRPTT